jgi:hypothetical protein
MRKHIVAFGRELPESRRYSKRGSGKTNWGSPFPVASMSGAPSASDFSNPGSRKIDAIASAGKLAEAVITAEGLSISPIRKDETDESEGIARRLYSMLPRLRITCDFDGRLRRRGQTNRKRYT